MPGNKLTALLLGAALLSGCASPVSVGRTTYESHCASCHGETGRGDGILAAQLPTRPADLTRLSAGNGGVFPATRVMSMIDGYTRQDQHGATMPEFGPLLAGDTVLWEAPDGTVVPTPEKLLALAAYLQSIQD